MLLRTCENFTVVPIPDLIKCSQLTSTAPPPAPDSASGADGRFPRRRRHGLAGRPCAHLELALCTVFTERTREGNQGFGARAARVGRCTRGVKLPGKPQQAPFFAWSTPVRAASPPQVAH